MLERQKRGRSIMWIGHELTENSRRWLQSGLMDIVLDQAPEVQARRALDTVLHRIGFLDVEVSADPVRFFTISAENSVTLNGICRPGPAPVRDCPW